MNNQSQDELNLTTHRSTDSVWGQSGWDGQKQPLAATRILVGIGGSALALQGLRLRSWQGRMLAGLGGTLAWWAFTGEGDLTEARRWFSSVLDGRWAKHDLVHESSDESFPASDSPSWTPTVGTGVRRSTPAH